MIKQAEFKLRLNEKQFNTATRSMQKNWSRSTTRMRRDIKQVTSTFERETLKMEAPAERLGRNVALVAAQFTPLRLAIGAGIGVAKMGKDFAEFEKQLIAVGKTADIEGNKLLAFGDDIQALASPDKGGIPVKTGELLELAEAAGQLGVKGTSNLLLFSRTMAELASASDVSGQEGALSVTRILKITNEDIKQVDTFTNVLVGLGNQSAATESEILKVATRVAQSTAAFKLSSTEILGISAGLRSLGVEAEIGGTSVQKTLLTMRDALVNGGQAMEQLQLVTGKTREQLKTLFDEDQAGLLNEFIAGLNRVQKKGGDVIATLSGLGITETRQLTVVSALAKGYDDFSASLRIAQEEETANNARSREAAKAFESMSSKVTEAGTQFERLTTEAGEFASPVFVATLNVISGLFGGIADNIEAANQHMRDSNSTWVKSARLINETARIVVDGTTGLVSFALTPFSSTKRLLGSTEQAVAKSAKNIVKTQDALAASAAKNTKKIKKENKNLGESYEKVGKSGAKSFELMSTSIQGSVAKQLAAINKQRAAAQQSLALVKTVRAELEAAENAVNGADSGADDFSDVSERIVAARKAFDGGDGDMVQTVKLAREGVALIEQLRADDKVDSSLARAGLAELRKLIDPASAKLEEDASREISKINEVAKSLRAVNVGIDEASAKAAANQLKGIFETQLQGLKLNGVNMADLDPAANVLRPYQDTGPAEKTQTEKYINAVKDPITRKILLDTAEAEAQIIALQKMAEQPAVKKVTTIYSDGNSFSDRPIAADDIDREARKRGKK